MKSQKRHAPQGELRQSQLLTTFGAGSMVDLPKHSVVIGGISFWKGEKIPLREDRLTAKICEVLKAHEVKLFTPPRQLSEIDAPPSGVEAFIFPSWFLLQVENYVHKEGGKEYRTRPLVRWNAVKGGAKYDGKRVQAVPVRFVQGCINGHLHDIDWYAFAHNDFRTTCREQLWLDEAGTGSDFEEIFVRCATCEVRRPLSQAKVKDSKVLGPCQGMRPWLGERGQDEKPCVAYEVDGLGNIVETDKREYNRLLVRSASNAYFSQTLSVIALSEPDAELRRIVDRFFDDDLQYCEDTAEVAKELRKPKFSDLVSFGAETVWQEIERRKNKTQIPEKSIKKVELEALLNAPEEKGKAVLLRNKEFDARARNLDTLDQKWKPYISRIVQVHRLREVIAQIGFTRFEAAMPNIEGEIDDLAINVRRAALDFETKWIPAIENKGEGIFIAFDKNKIEEWTRQPKVRDRGIRLEQGFYQWVESKGLSPQKAKFPGLPYIMLHSLSHLLITAVSLECGYAASAIRERIYAFPDTGYGILLHTGASSSDGTLGGLVEVGSRIESHLEKALELGRLCSNDPVCAEHDPANTQEARFLHGAACHGCLLIAETSCERRNESLDRALVVDTVEDLGAAFFPPDLV